MIIDRFKLYQVMKIAESDVSSLIICKHVVHVRAVFVLDEQVNNDSLQECSTCCIGLYMHKES